MRNWFTALLLLLTSVAGLAQHQYASGNSTAFRKLVMRDTVSLPGVPRDEIYSRAWKWFSEIAKENPGLFQEADKRFGRFTGNATIAFNTNQPGSGSEYVKGFIYYTLNVYVDNEYYTYEITDFTHSARIPFNVITTHPTYPYKPIGNIDNQWHNDVWKEMKDKIQSRTNPIIVSLKEGMQKETEKFELYKQLYEKDPSNPRLGTNE